MASNFFRISAESGYSNRGGQGICRLGSHRTQETQHDQVNNSARSVIPVDDPRRKLTVANPDVANMRHVSIAGDTYTILVSGDQTAGRYCLIPMHLPAGGGPPPHRHDFEEMFTLLQGELRIHLPRRDVDDPRAGSTVNIPANAKPPSRTVPARPCGCSLWLGRQA